MVQRKCDLLILLVVAGSYVQYAAAQRPGSIQGTVIDGEQIPVPNAQVRVDPIESAPRADVVRIVDTDNAGHFSVDALELTTYKVFAMKETSGYPNTAAAFYSNHVFPTVTLTGAAPVAEVTLRIGPPAGVVEGTVRDANSGSPVATSILLRRAADPSNWISMSQPPDYCVLVPPDVDVTVEVLAPGYKTWYYGGAADVLKRPPIRLESRNKMHLDIELEPDESQPKP